MTSVAIGMFCEDVRDEASGAQTIVGILPDNVNLPKVPALIPRLNLYLRLLLDPDAPPEPIMVALSFPNTETKEFPLLDAAGVTEACAQAKGTGMPYAGIVSRLVMGNFPVSQPGRLTATVAMQGGKYICAALNIQVGSTSSSNEFAPHSTQSLPAAPSKET